MAALDRALRSLALRQASLRTRFAQAAGEPVQIVEPAVPRLLVVDAPRDAAKLLERPETDME